MTMTVAEAVQAGTDAYAAVEKHLLKAQDELLKLPAVYEALRAAGAIGYLEALELSAEARASAGDVAATESVVVTSHRARTARAAELGIDLPPPPALMATSLTSPQPLGGSR